VLDGRNVNFIKTVTTITYGDIVLTGNVTNPTIQNSANRELSIFYADSAGAGLTEVVVEFDELLPTNTAQQIWIDTLTEAGATSASTAAANRISALQALQTAYVAANSVNGLGKLHWQLLQHCLEPRPYPQPRVPGYSGQCKYRCQLGNSGS
jgi:hypothetical protein